MKKRIGALMLFLVLIMMLIPVAQGSGTVCFVGVNDSVPMYLPGSEAPYYKGGTLYVPYTVFNASPGGIAVSYNVDKGSLVLFTRAKRLVYDLNAGTVMDETEKGGRVEVVYRNGVLFIPAQRAVSHFGLAATMLTSASGSPVLRFTDGSQKLDDSTFIRKAETLIAIILDQQSPDRSPDGQKEDSDRQEEEPVAVPTAVYLAFAGDAVSAQTLQTLSTMKVYAAFFLTQQQIEADPSLVREIYAQGHQVGLTVLSEETDPEQALKNANDALDRVLFCKSLMVLLPGTAQDLPQYAVFREWPGQTLDTVLENGDAVRLLVCRTDAAMVLQKMLQEGVFTPQLMETTRIPGVSTR